MIQISLRIRIAWSESSLGAPWLAKDAKFLHANNEDADQIVRLVQMSEDTFSHIAAHILEFFHLLSFTVWME